MSRSLRSILIIACLLALLILSVIALGDTLTPLVFSLILAYLLFPTIKKIESKGIPRNIAIISIFSLLLIFGLLILYFVLPGLIQDINSLIKDFPEMLRNLVTKAKGFFANSDFKNSIDIHSLTESAKEFLASSASSFLKGLKSSFANMTSFFMGVLGLSFIPLFFFYFISDYEKISEGIVSFIPKPNRKKLKHYLDLSNRVLSGYIRGQLLVVLALSVLYSVGLWVIGLKFGFLIGLLTGAFSIVPYLGVVIGLAASVGIALSSHAGFDMYIAIGVVFVIVQSLEGFIITPKLVGNKVGLSSFATLLVLIMGGNLMGLVGMVMAIPLAAILKSFIAELKGEYQKSSFFTGK